MSDNLNPSVPTIKTQQFLELLAEWFNAEGGPHEDLWLTKIVDHVSDAMKAFGDRRYQEGCSVMRGQLAETAIKCFEAGEEFALKKAIAGADGQPTLPAASVFVGALRDTILTLCANGSAEESHQQGFDAGVHAAAALLAKDHGYAMFQSERAELEERQTISPLPLVGAVNILLERYDELRGNRPPAAEFEILRAALAAHQGLKPKATEPQVVHMTEPYQAGELNSAFIGRWKCIPLAFGDGTAIIKEGAGTLLFQFSDYKVAQVMTHAHNSSIDAALTNS